MDRPRRYRSLLWPIILIGVGLIWLLNNMGIIPLANINALISLWPLILIIIGLDILFGRRSVVASAIIGLITIAAIIFVLIAAPVLNLPQVGNLQHDSKIESLAGITSATVELDLSPLPTRIHSLNSTEDLLQSEIDHYGALNYSASGSPVRHISISEGNVGGTINFSFNPAARWDIGLSTAVPVDLTVDGGSGSATIDLTGVQLSAFSFDQGSGSFNVTLPMSPQEYTVNAVGGSGSMAMELPAQTSLTLHLEGHSGSISLRLPVNAGVRLEVVDSGSGSVSYPRIWEQINGNDEKQGTWQSSGYDSAAYKLNIICDRLGSGSFNIR